MQDHPLLPGKSFSVIRQVGEGSASRKSAASTKPISPRVATSLGLQEGRQTRGERAAKSLVDLSQQLNLQSGSLLPA